MWAALSISEKKKLKLTNLKNCELCNTAHALVASSASRKSLVFFDDQYVRDSQKEITEYHYTLDLSFRGYQGLSLCFSSVTILILN